MGRRGPMPTPTALKLARGETRPSRHNQREPATLAVARAVRAPGWLDPLGRRTWRDLVVVLRRMRVLGEQDQLLLAILCDQVSVYRRAAGVLAEKGESFVVLDGDGNPRGVQAYPQVTIRQRAAEEIRKLAEHFGLSPSARVRLEVEAPAPAASALDRFVARRPA